MIEFEKASKRLSKPKIFDKAMEQEENELIDIDLFVEGLALCAATIPFSDISVPNPEKVKYCLI